MPKYRVYAQELLVHEVEVEAENVAEALEIVRKSDVEGDEFVCVEAFWFEPENWEIEDLADASTAG
jgi:hypothetical protein